jgi:two-component system sensor histidine kinase QseC
VKSIQSRILTGIILCNTLLLLGGSVLLYVVVRSLLVHQFDDVLQTKVGLLATLTEQRGVEIELHFADEFMPEFEAEADPEYFQVWIDGGGVLERSNSLAGADLPRVFGTIAEPVIQDLDLPDGRAGRMIGIRVPVEEYRPFRGVDPGRATVIIVQARGRVRLDTVLAGLSLRLALLALVLVFLTSSLTLWTVRRGLSPLAGVAAHVKAMDLPKLPAALSTAGLPRELVDVVERLNELTERLRAAFARERRTTANIAHELRTPISELQALTEVALRWPDDPQYSADVNRQAHAIALQMKRQITTILQLARAESESFEPQPEPLSLRGELARCWEEHRQAAEHKEQRFHLDVPADRLVLADRSVVEILLHNLLHNAVEYAPRGGDIDCAAASANGHVTLTISNPDASLSPADLENLAEPFWRKDEARRNPAHVGLGLALVKQLAAVSHIPLGFGLESGRFQVSLSFTAPHRAGSVELPP